MEGAGTNFDDTGSGLNVITLGTIDGVPLPIASNAWFDQSGNNHSYLTQVVSSLNLAIRIESLMTAPVPTRILGLSGNLVFGNVLINTTATRTLIITNSGNTTLNVYSIGYPSGFSGVSLSGVVGAGAGTNVVVTFSPTAATDYGGMITINSDMTCGTNTIACSGTGVIPPFITMQPLNVTTNIGGTGLFSVTASGTDPFNYQW